MNEVDGVVPAPNTSSGIADLLSGRKPATKGVRVEVGTEEASVDLVMAVEYGKPIQKVAIEVQENVRKAIETMTGLKVVKVDVRVVGISFEKETQELTAGYEKATAKPEDMNNEGPTADVDDPPAGVDPDELTVRNVHMDDNHMHDENEEISAGMDGKSEWDNEGV